ncbi:cobyrinic acid a,c-diamide synthase [Tetzosporium hominis]|uniref:Cobyrinic acid a,c-diamide synthase n=1 Tax=Tetzosporium hominis TaxID=2020506 RepID=A0A264W181_9BACL|nr:ParA family protein [Tetzosporium hominis]OZS77305.1 cobyrinic acid a,c-diamide synthase [Tetzosporium hominis]
MVAKTIVVGNFKGGVGKTKVSVMTSWEYSNVHNKRVLLVDMDPQGNASTLIARTAGITEIERTIFEGFQDRDLSSVVLKVNDYLDLIPAAVSFKNFSKFLYQNYPTDLDQITLLKTLLEPLKEKYDYIIIDVPPTISDYSDNAMMASDYVLIILQAQELSLEGAETYVSYLQFMHDEYDADIQVLGVLPVLLRAGGRVDQSTVERATELFGEDNVFKSVVKHLERLKAWDVTGIKNEDHHDRKAHQIFLDVIKEMDEKLVRLEEEESNV